MSSRFFQTIALTMVAVMLAGACFGSEPDIDDSPNDFPFLIDDDGNFEKVDREYPDEDLVEEAESYNRDSVSNGRIALKRAREHMIPNRGHNQFALYPGEHFVLDIVYIAINFEIHRDFDIQVLGNFEPIAFHLIEVEIEDEFPSLTEVSTLDNPELVHRFSLPNDVTTKLTIVIPPESLEPMAYDLRVVVIPDTGHQEDVSVIRDPRLGFSMTLYNGGEAFPERPTLKATERKPFSHREHILLETGFFSNSLLLPSPEYLDSVQEGEEQLGQELEVDGDAKLAALYFADGFLEEEQEVYTSFVDGTEFVSDSWRLTKVEPRPNLGSNSANPTAPVAYHSTKIEEAKDFRFAIFSRPFQDQSSADQWQQLIELSNVIFLRNPVDE